MRIMKIAVIILSCVCLTSCNSEKINDAKKEVKKIPGYTTHNEKDAKRVEKDVKKIEKELKNMPGYIVHDIKNSKIKYSKKDAKRDAKRIAKEVPKIPGCIDNIKNSKITYSKEDADRIARYVANGEKSKFINEMAKNTMKKKGSMEKVNALFSYMDGTNIKTRHIDETSVKDFTRYNFEFSNEKNHDYLFNFDFVPVDMNDAGNTGVRSFYIVEIEGWRKGTWSQRRIRKPVELCFHRTKKGTLNGTLLGKLEELFDWARS